MKCEQYRSQIIHFINGQLSDAEMEAFRQHIDHCPDCLQELRAQQYIWDLMEEIPVPETSEKMHSQFLTMLDTFKAPSKKSVGFFANIGIRIREFWILQPRLQFAYAIVLVLIAITSGFLISKRSPQESYRQQIDSLSSQVTQMKEMMMLSLLENPSASERIRAVSYTNEINSANKKVINALLTTLNNDPNVNVRLMTLDALTHYANDQVVREGLVQSIVQQESPLVQSALADVMLKLQEKRSVPSFKKLLEQKELNQLVRSKIEKTIHRLI